MTFKREATWLAVAAAFGALALPLLVYFTGIAVLGPYSEGGPAAFYSAFLADLARLRWPAWTLVLGPPAVVLCWRAATSRGDSGSRGPVQGGEPGQ
jgi:hypothetical protein